MTTIDGLATKEGTTRFIERFPAPLETSSYRRFRKLRVSSVGIGTYLGEVSQQDDDGYRESIRGAINYGCNLIDTAIVYRHMRSERVVGEVLKELIDSRKIQRDEVLICSKGGYLPFDGDSAYSSPGDYWRRSFLDSKLLTEEEVERVGHSLSPDFILNQLEKSRENLGLSGIDVYYLHNPEVQLSIVSRQEFNAKLKDAFAVLEEAARAGKIGCYGLATWNGFRLDDTAKNYLSLSEIVDIARSVGGDQHNFGALQLPLNLSKTEAVKLNKQTMPGKPTKISVSSAAAEYRLGIFASAALDQGNLTRYIPPVIKQHFKKLESDTQVAVQFSRSCPAVVAALVGLKTKQHVDEVFGLFKCPPEAPENFVRLFESPEKSIVR